ncbi:hypothetical protein KAS41_01420 [Candidatus Parcubacteria bacterium]|nr:hypothetical protein [Candidatus Parcubacteria bacterium]
MRELTFYNQASRIIDKYDLKITGELRLGMRYYIAEAKMGKQKAIFKINLQNRSDNQEAEQSYKQLKREIEFLNFIKKSGNDFLISALPDILYCGIDKNRIWYIKKYADGQIQSYKNSAFLFRQSFFNKKNINWLINFISNFENISKNKKVKRLKNLYQLTLLDYKNFVAKPSKKINKIYFSNFNVSAAVDEFLKIREKKFNRTQNVLCHFEPYAAHFIKQKSGFCVIDWENIGWGNIAHDISIIWNRAFLNPAWQKKLISELNKNLKNSDFQKLFEIEILIQSLGNLVFWHYNKNKNELPFRKKYITFAKNNILDILNRKFINKNF